MLLFSLLLTACSGSEDVASNDFIFVPSDDTWVEEEVDGSSCTVKPFTPGDEVTRTSLTYDGQNMVFGWKVHDLVALYPTAKVFAEENYSDLSDNDKPYYLDPTSVPANRHPNYQKLGNANEFYRSEPERAPQYAFVCLNETSSQTAQFFSTFGDFQWDDKVQWTAYYPYSVEKETNPETHDTEHYDTRTYSYSGQKQTGIPDYVLYKKASPTAEDNNKYRASEVQASAHLGKYDYMISSEMAWNGERINFQMRHVGAIARVTLRAPAEDKRLVITNVKLICDKAIFYNGGQFNLKSHVYVNNEAANYGVNLNLSDPDCQIQPVGDPVNMIQIDFDGESAVTYYSASQYSRYLTAYIMMYPITYTAATDGNLFAYVTAHEEGDSEKEYNFVSSPLSDKTMVPGKYYQWTSATHADSGLYPIELTATLQPWQEIVGSSIGTDLTK